MFTRKSCRGVWRRDSQEDLPLEEPNKLGTPGGYWRGMTFMQPVSEHEISSFRLFGSGERWQPRASQVGLDLRGLVDGQRWSFRMSWRQYIRSSGAETD